MNQDSEDEKLFVNRYEILRILIRKNRLTSGSVMDYLKSSAVRASLVF